ncbi:MAG: RNA 2',3'-cyclic phosphodiesterase [Chloroflexi bacterium]|nr:RNA 2',3'-cyclic phosphodiesterase [Chloroflexota bacterium]
MRTFVAIELDAGVKDALAACLAAMQRAAPPMRLKWVPPASQHLTLQFLGEIERGDVAAVSAALRAAAVSITPFDMALTGLGCFPGSTRPNVLWVGVAEPGGSLARLQQAVAMQLAPLGFEPDHGAFKPHLTLARVPRDASPGDRRALGEWFMRQPPPAPQSQRVTAIHLMQSQLLPGGAQYTALETLDLAQPRGAKPSA